MTTSEFYNLPRRARIERCRRVAIAALEHWHVTPGKLRLIPALHPNFRVEDTSGGQYLLKFLFDTDLPVHERLGIEPWYSFHSCTQDQQFEWHESLGAQTDLRLQTPLRTNAGEFVQHVPIPGLPDPVGLTLSTWLPGRILAKGWPRRQPGEQMTRKIGRVTATMHAHAASWRPSKTPLAYSPWASTAQRVYEFSMRYKPGASVMSAADRDLVDRAMDRVLRVFSDMDSDPDCHGIIHADICPHNLLLHDGNVTPIDFNPISGLFLWDITLLFDSPEFNTPKFDPFYRAWFAGYDEVRPLPANYVEMAEAIFMFFGMSQIYNNVCESDHAAEVVPAIKVPRVLWLADRMLNGPPFPPLSTD